MSEYNFSIIIPLFNKEHTIERAILSVLEQDGIEAEIIIVDDGSTDASIEVAEQYSENVNLIRQANSGPSVARNNGVSASHNQLLMFLDADDVLLPGCLSAHMEARKSHDNILCSISSFKVEFPDGHEYIEELARRVYDLNRTGNSYYIKGLDSRLLSGIHSGSICVDRKLFDEVSGFDERLKCWEITDFMIKCMMHGEITAIIDGVYANKIEESSPKDSQFEKTKQNSRYLMQFGHNLLCYINDVPDSEKPWFISQIKNIVYQLWDNGDIDNFVNLSMISKEYINNQPNRSILNIGKLPRILLSIIYRIRSMLHRYAGS